MLNFRHEIQFLSAININEAQSPSGTLGFVCCLLYVLPGQVWNGSPPLPEFLSAWALPGVKCLCLQDWRRDRGSCASLTASMSTQPGVQDGETSPVMERLYILVTNPLLGHKNLLLVLLCPHLTQSHKQQLSQSGGKIILSRKLALTSKILIDHQICVLQNSWLEAGQSCATGIVWLTLQSFLPRGKVLYWKVFFCMFASSLYIPIRSSLYPWPISSCLFALK